MAEKGKCSWVLSEFKSYEVKNIMCVLKKET